MEISACAVLNVYVLAQSQYEPDMIVSLDLKFWTEDRALMMSTGET